MADEVKPQEKLKHPNAERIRYLRDQISPTWNETKKLMGVKKEVGNDYTEGYWKTRKEFTNALYKKEQEGLIDGLTLLLNRQGVLKRLEAERNRTIRKLEAGKKTEEEKYKIHQETRFAVMFLDVNGLKEFNDAVGYAAGDKVLQNAAIALGSVSRPYEIVGRWGGDEFIVILPETDVEGALKHWGRTSEALKNHSVWISAGLSIGDPKHIEESMLKAENSMKEAKKLAKERFNKMGLRENVLKTAENSIPAAK